MKIKRIESFKMSKYSRLSSEVLIKKLKSYINDEIPDLSIEANKLIKDFGTDDFSRENAEILLDKFEFIIKQIKEEKKRDEENKKREEEEKVKEEEKKREEEKRLEKEEKQPMISSSRFNELKSAFGIMKENEHGDYIFSNLQEQSLNEILTCNSEILNSNQEFLEKLIINPELEIKVYDPNLCKLKLYKANYKESIRFDEDKDYIHKNLNGGFVNIFEDMKDYIFAVFRLNINPLNGNCIYSSWWIVNSFSDIRSLIKSDSSMFDFTEVNQENISEFLHEFKKCEPGTVLDEKYLK